MNGGCSFQTSKELFQHAQKLFVGGVASSLHKSSYEEHPLYIERGIGSRVRDVDGNEFIDYLAGYGPLVLGYSSAAVKEAVRQQLENGGLFAAPTESINAVSEKIIEHVPCAELVTYQTTGTEAVMLALRIARASTKKEKIVRFEGHYHGWSDEAMISHAPGSLSAMGSRGRPKKVFGSKGQPKSAGRNIIVLPWNDLEMLRTTIRRHQDSIAAVIMEPVMCNCEVVYPRQNFLQEVRELTARHGIVLIFDEIITGFRLGLGGAQGYFGVVPDLCTLGKALAGGLPLSCVAGKGSVMASGVNPRGTFNANPISIAACQASIKELEKPFFYEKLEALTKKLVAGVRERLDQRGVVFLATHMGSIWQLAFGVSEPLNDYRETFKVDKLAYQNFRQACLVRGVRLHPTRGRQYVSGAHTDDDVDQTLAVVEEVSAEVF
jgi:glutamate-1-semialdehyde 2,1-aminomutase